MTAERDASTPVLLVGAGPGHLDLLTLDAETAIRAARELVADRSLASLLDALAAEAELRASPWVEGRPPAAHLDVAAAGHAAGAHMASAVTQSQPAVSVHHHGHDGPVGEADEPGDAGAVLCGAPAAASVMWVDDDQPASTDMLAAVGRGSGVVRLYRGDPWFHPAGDAERAALRADGHRFELVPGVIEELAVLAAAGIPVQVRTLAVTTTFAVHDPLRSSGRTEGPTFPGTGRTVTAGPMSDRPGATPEAPAVPVNSAHALVVRTTDLAATARWLADRADPSGILLDRPAAAVATGPGDHRPAEAIRATVASLVSLVPAGPGLVVVGLVAALDTTLVRVTVVGPRPGSACETGRERSPGTRRTSAMAPADRPARETGREGEAGTSRSNEPGHRSGAGR